MGDGSRAGCGIAEALRGFGHYGIGTASMGDPGERQGPCRVSMTSASSHHDAVMLGFVVRTTIDLPDDLHKQAQAIARDTHRTLSETVADLMRRGLGAGTSTAHSTDPRTGLPIVSVGTIVTSEDVRSLEDEG
jgi:Arc/MetJ family transcription regulator